MRSAIRVNSGTVYPRACRARAASTTRMHRSSRTSPVTGSVTGIDLLTHTGAEAAVHPDRDIQVRPGDLTRRVGGADPRQVHPAAPAAAPHPRRRRRCRRRRGRRRR